MHPLDTPRIRDRHVSWHRLLGAGMLLAVLAAVAGFALEWVRFGWSESQAMARVDAEVRREFGVMTALLGERGDAIAGDPGT
ncbi:MAG: hypothetical protein H0W08_09560, partial [Acidobacteria bacterium]|nr:hypothetical protein [Acidobacteriota bacterium]